MLFITNCGCGKFHFIGVIRKMIKYYPWNVLVLSNLRSKMRESYEKESHLRSNYKVLINCTSTLSRQHSTQIEKCCFFHFSLLTTKLIKMWIFIVHGNGFSAIIRNENETKIYQRK